MIENRYLIQTFTTKYDFEIRGKYKSSKPKKKEVISTYFQLVLVQFAFTNPTIPNIWTRMSALYLKRLGPARNDEV